MGPPNGFAPRSLGAVQRSHRSGRCSRAYPIGRGFAAYGARGELLPEAPRSVAGEIVEGGDASGVFDGVAELADRLARSREVESCVAEQYLQYAVGRALVPDDSCTRERISAAFSASRGDLRELLIAIVMTDAFRRVRLPDAVADEVAR